MKRTLFLTLLISLVLTACSKLPNAATLPVTNTGLVEMVTPTSEPVIATPSESVMGFDFSRGLTPVAVDGTYLFSEGPATDGNGDIYFSDVDAGKIYRWSPDGNVSLFLAGLNMPNGLMFAADGSLVACEGGNGRLIAIDRQGNITVLADQYNGVRFNEPNDLWIDPGGGIYFTDPVYKSALSQDGESVYYLSPVDHQVSRVIDDLVRPNGIVGTPDGSTLYVADHGAGKTYAYTIQDDGSLANKRLFIPLGSDGMTLDAAGNLYLTTPNQVRIYDNTGTYLKDIATGEDPTNVTFSGTDGNILFITARTAVYVVQMSPMGSKQGNSPVPPADSGAFILTSPDVANDGTLPAEFTCDGAASTLALSWSGAPEGTVGYAVIMHHVASPEDIHWYLVLYDIPADVTSLSKNFTGIGTHGTNSVNDRTEYAPPCSKGPGAKEYIYTVYALSAQPSLDVPPAQVNRAVLLDAIQEITLASAELHVTYTRP